METLKELKWSITVCLIAFGLLGYLAYTAPPYNDRDWKGAPHLMYRTEPIPVKGWEPGLLDPGNTKGGEKVDPAVQAIADAIRKANSDPASTGMIKTSIPTTPNIKVLSFKDGHFEAIPNK